MITRYLLDGVKQSFLPEFADFNNTVKHLPSSDIIDVTSSDQFLHFLKENITRSSVSFNFFIVIL